MGLLKERTPKGDRYWGIKDWVQGKPLGHPSHTMFVHFPIAFYLGAVVVDGLSLLGEFDDAPLIATWMIIGGLIGSVPAVVTGLVDWWGMISGSKRKRWATIHMLLQLASAGFFVLNLVARWPARLQAEADILWMVLGIVGVGIQLVGNWMGGNLVFRMGMRVQAGSNS